MALEKLVNGNLVRKPQDTPGGMDSDVRRMQKHDKQCKDLSCSRTLHDGGPESVPEARDTKIFFDYLNKLNRTDPYGLRQKRFRTNLLYCLFISAKNRNLSGLI